MAHLTRLGARSVTTDLDRIAGLFQEQHAALGVPQELALKFAYYCDALSDQVERHAIKLAEDDSDEKDDDSEEVEVEEGKTASNKQAQVDETGLSVDHGESGFDANEIGDDVGGPDEILAPVESWMNGHFSQVNFQQLRDKQESGDIGFFVSASEARLRRQAAVYALPGLVAALGSLHTSLSKSASTKVLASSIQKQAQQVASLRDLALNQMTQGGFSPRVMAAADMVSQAMAEQIPFIQQVVAGTLAPDAVKGILSLSASILDAEAPKATQVASEDEQEEEVEETASKKAEDKGEDKDESEKDETKEEVEEGKTAKTHGYNLFA